MTTTTPAAVLAAKIQDLMRSSLMSNKNEAKASVMLEQLREMAEGAQGEANPHRWLFTDEHGLEGVTSLNPSQWNARSRNSRTGVMALYAAPVAAKQAEPDSEEAIRIWHKHCDPFRSKLGEHPPSVVINAMREFAACAVPAAVAPEGWVMVPMVATTEQVVAAYEAQGEATSEACEQIYRAMLDASPAPPASTDRAMGAEGRLPLTDEQIDAITRPLYCSAYLHELSRKDDRNTARAIERAHGITAPPSDATSAEG